MSRLIVLLVLLLVLALGVLLLEKPRMDEEKAVREGKTTSVKLFADITKDAISRVVISDGLTVKTIRKEGDGCWTISDNGTNFWKTESEKIDELLKNITEEMTDETLASESVDKQDKFEVTEALGTKVQVFTSGEEPVATFFVGKQGPDYISTYVRKDGDNNIYSIPVQLGTIYGREMNGWRDKHMWDFDPKTVTEAMFKFGESIYRVKLENGEWMLLEPEQGKANGVKIESELKALSEMVGAGFIPDSIEEAFLDKPENEIRLKTADGKETALLISKEVEGYYNTIIEGKPEAVLKVPKADFGPLFINSISQIRFDPTLTETPSEDHPAEGASGKTESPTGSGDAEPTEDNGASEDKTDSGA